MEEEQHYVILDMLLPATNTAPRRSAMPV
jgi:hypothetical protein